MSTELDTVVNMLTELRGEMQQLRVQLNELKPQPPEEGGMELATELLGLAPYTIRQKCLDGLIPHTRIGRNYRFNRQELLQLLASKKQHTASHLAEMAQRGTRSKNNA